MKLLKKCTTSFFLTLLLLFPLASFANYKWNVDNNGNIQGMTIEYSTAYNFVNGTHPASQESEVNNRLQEIASMTSDSAQYSAMHDLYLKVMDYIAQDKNSGSSNQDQNGGNGNQDQNGGSDNQDQNGGNGNQDQNGGSDNQDQNGGNGNQDQNTGGSNQNQNTGNSTQDQNTGPVKLLNPLSFDSICALVNFLVNLITEVGAIIGVLFIIWSGFLFIYAQGNVTKLNAAKSTLYTTLIGIAILLGSSVLTKVIVGTVASVLGVSSSSCTF